MFSNVQSKVVGWAELRRVPPKIYWWDSPKLGPPYTYPRPTPKRGRITWLAVLVSAWVLAMASTAQAQPRPYIGFVYPAGGQQGATFQIRLGGQNLDGVHDVQVTGTGVRAKVVEYLRRLNPQETTLLREQLTELKKPAAAKDESALKLAARIQQRLDQFVPTPACNSIANLALVEVAIAADAAPGPRELTLTTLRGVSNPLVFHVGQLPEISRKPMLTATLQVLGKEEQALRKRPPDEVQQRITLPCTVNGQIASGEVNRYRFEARKGQRLVFSTQARQLVPFIADAVPGWFQPVMAVYDARGKELAYCDDYRFKPDPVILFEVPKDGEYVFTITDAIYRGREDFVYRVTAGELPFVTSIFPLGARVGGAAKIEMKGWNLDEAELQLPPPGAKPGIHWIAANRKGIVSNLVPLALGTLPEMFEKEPNNDLAHAQKVTLPTIINGRIDRKDDWDVFQFTGHAGETVVAEVFARRLDSPLDSVLKVTDAKGKLLAYNDDFEDPQAGTNTHDADSYLSLKLPADGTYYVHLGDTARSGGEEYAYRLRIGPPQPDFALFCVPSGISAASKGTGVVNVHVSRKDGFAGPIKLGLKDPPAGFSSRPLTLSGTQTIARLPVKTTLTESPEPVRLVIEGRAKIGPREVVRVAVPAEDRMQAFLWRHLVPAQDMKMLVFSPAKEPPSKRLRQTPAPPKVAGTVPVPSAAAAKPKVAGTVPVPSAAAAKPKFTKQQVVNHLRQIKLLFEEGYLTEDFYDHKVAECEAEL